jgi:hypothetical protein
VEDWTGRQRAVVEVVVDSTSGGLDRPPEGGGVHSKAGDWQDLAADTLHTDPPALHCTALHCTALHCTALHCTALHCTALL